MATKAKTTKTEPTRFVAFDDDGMVRLTCLTRVEDRDPNAALFAIGYSLMRLVETFTEIRDFAKAEAEAETDAAAAS